MIRLFSTKATKLIPLSLQINRYNRITGIRLPSELQNKTIYDLLSEDINYSFFLDKEQLLKMLKHKKPNDTFLL